MSSAAKRFAESGTVKEFVDDEEEHYYVIQFEDDSGLVLRREPSDGDASVAEFIPREEPVTASVERIADVNGIQIRDSNTRQKVRDLLREERK